jgi:hypothetical protein
MLESFRVAYAESNSDRSGALKGVYHFTNTLLFSGQK